MAIASRDDDEPSIQFGRWAASDEKGREENAGERVGCEQGLVHLCMLVYTCNVCMYGMANL